MSMKLAVTPEVGPEGLTAREHFEQHPEDLQTLQKVAFSFREFLNYWYFVDQRTGVVRCLGEELWAAQEKFVNAIADPESIDSESGMDWIFYLKARKLGETTIECAYDAWCARFRGGAINARVHLFSKKEKDAQNLLKWVKFGMRKLPWWMQLPDGSVSTMTEWTMKGGPEDERFVVAYPSDMETAVADTCTHGHVDEWARMGNPEKVWQAIEPTMAGSCHIVTTGLGPTNYSSVYWKRCLAREARHRGLFIGALNRPDRDEAWLAAKKKSTGGGSAFFQEYPMRWEDALSGGGNLVFDSFDVDDAGVDFRYALEPGPHQFQFGTPQPGRRYALGADIGRHQDAAVIIVLDVTEDVHDVAWYERLREKSYPTIQARIEQTRLAFRNPALKLRLSWGVEANAAGEAVLENLNVPEEEIKEAKFTTSKPSKARIIQQTNVQLQARCLKWDPKACEQLDAEMRGYQEPDDNVVQDSVIALSIAEDYSTKGTQGRMLRIGTW